MHAVIKVSIITETMQSVIRMLITNCRYAVHSDFATAPSHVSSPGEPLKCETEDSSCLSTHHLIAKGSFFMYTVLHSRGVT